MDFREQLIMKDNQNSGATTIALHLETAVTFTERLKGLLGRGSLPQGNGMLIKHCLSIHTMFMRFAIDILYINAEFVVVKTVEALKPWRMSCCLTACAVIELPEGSIQKYKIQTGSELEVRYANV